MADLVDARSFGTVSSPSGPKARLSKKHHTVDPLSRNSRFDVRSCSLVVNTVRTARLPGVDDVDGPFPQPSAVRGGDEIRDDEETVATVGGHLIPIEHARIVPFGHVASLRDVDLTVLGSTVRHPIDHVEVFPAPANVTSVRFTNDEVTSMCPVTQQPDLSNVVIEYVPGEWCVESKSLKLYLWGFRDRAVFAEALAAEIAGEIMTTAQPSRVTVTLTQRPRGGIEVQAVAELTR